MEFVDPSVNLACEREYALEGIVEISSFPISCESDFAGVHLARFRFQIDYCRLPLETEYEKRFANTCRAYVRAVDKKVFDPERFGITA